MHATPSICSFSDQSIIERVPKQDINSSDQYSGFQYEQVLKLLWGVNNSSSEMKTCSVMKYCYILIGNKGKRVWSGTLLANNSCCSRTK